MNTPSTDTAEPGWIGKLASPPAGFQSNRIAFWTMCAVILSVAISVSALTPVLTAAALFPFFRGAMKNGAYRDAFHFALRWGVILFVSVTLTGIYLPGRTVESVPFAAAFIEQISAWVRGTQTGAPFGPLAIAAGIAAVAIVSLISGGLGAIVVGAGALGCAACGFTYLLRHGDNAVWMVVAGNPPWIVAFACAGLFLLVPTAAPFYSRRFGTASADTGNTAFIRTCAIIAATLAFASILCALLLDETWRILLRNCTVV
jgi:hypothetical protein